MKRTFIQTKEFSRRWDELGLDDEDLRTIEFDIMKNPDKYPIIQGTGGLRKARVAINNKGKSGGARVCYVDFVFAEVVYLITVYSKKEKDNLSKEERNEIKKAIDLLRRVSKVNDMGKNNVYDSIMTGLNEALEDVQSEKKTLKRNSISVEPVRVFGADEVKKIRLSTGMSQRNFASYMGVSDKTVEAWEAGTNHPSGAASRLLSMLEKDKELIVKFPFVTNAIAK